MNLPLDKYGHVDLPEAKTDPYGELEFAVGSGDDFVCFDYAIFQFEGDTYVILHSTLNSETGSFSFIEDFEYKIINATKDDWEGETIHAAYDMICAALDLCADTDDKPIRHDKKGWNQDPFYFVRALTRNFYRHGLKTERIAPFLRKASWFRFGAKTLNRQIEAIAPGIKLPVTKRPKTYNQTFKESF